MSYQGSARARSKKGSIYASGSLRLGHPRACLSAGTFVVLPADARIGQVCAVAEVREDALVRNPIVLGLLSYLCTGISYYHGGP